jgi:hypothetical protein
MIAPTGNIIWQYWETRGEKPRFIDGFHDIARRNSGVKIILVMPETLREYLPDIEEEIFRIEDLAHKADMIRTRLVQKYGGMWLDADAVVLSDLNWLFDRLKDHEFVGFNNGGRLQQERPWVRVCCFLSRPNGAIVSRWVEAQRAKLSKTTFRWSEIGAEMLNAACLENQDRLEILPFEKICPIGPKRVAEFMTVDDTLAAQIVRDCFMVMVSNRSVQKNELSLPKLSVEEIAGGDYVLSRIVRHAHNRS